MGDFVYIDEISLCNKGRSRYMTNLASSHKFNVGDEFAATVCSLSGIYDNQSYMDFLQDWGTVSMKKVPVSLNFCNDILYTVVFLHHHIITKKPDI